MQNYSAVKDSRSVIDAFKYYSNKLKWIVVRNVRAA